MRSASRRPLLRESFPLISEQAVLTARLRAKACQEWPETSRPTASVQPQAIRMWGLWRSVSQTWWCRGGKGLADRRTVLIMACLIKT